MGAPAFVVIGGGEVGAGYTRRLLWAADTGRIRLARVVVVDREPGCAAARLGDPRASLEIADWAEWLDAGLERLAPTDHLVPHHWAPHLLRGWLERQLARAGLAAVPLETPPRGLPFEAPTRAGDRALSYATWTCPPTCLEPALCPHTRGPRSWSLAGDLAAPPPGFDLALAFRSLHLAAGVASIPVADILCARDHLLAEAARGPRRVQVATASHCHGLAAGLEVEAPNLISPDQA